MEWDAIHVMLDGFVRYQVGWHNVGQVGLLLGRLRGYEAGWGDMGQVDVLWRRLV